MAWSFFRSLGNYIFNLFTRAVTVKFFIMAALFAAVTELTNAALSMISFEDGSGVSSAISSLPNDVLYFLGLFRLDVGLPMLFAAMIARFTIRRLPIIG